MLFSKRSSLPKPLDTILETCQHHLIAWRKQPRPKVINCQGEILDVGVTTLLQRLKSLVEKRANIGPVAYLDWADWSSQYPTPDGLENALAALDMPSVLLLDHVPWRTNASLYTQTMGKWLSENFLQAHNGMLFYGSLRFWKPKGKWPKPEETLGVPLINDIPWLLSELLKEKQSEHDAVLAYLQHWKKWEQHNFTGKPLAKRLREWCHTQGKINGWEWPSPWCSEIAPETRFHQGLQPWMEKACQYRLWEPLEEENQ